MSAPLSAERTYQLILQCAAGMPANDDDLVDIGCAMTELRYARTFILELQAALKKCVAIIEDIDEAMPMDAGCIQCTAGTVPNHLNTGLCGYHAAKGLLEPRT